MRSFFSFMTVCLAAVTIFTFVLHERLSYRNLEPEVNGCANGYVTIRVADYGRIYKISKGKKIPCQ